MLGIRNQNPFGLKQGSENLTFLTRKKTSMFFEYILSAKSLHTLFHLILTTDLSGRCSPSFSKEEMVAQQQVNSSGTEQDSNAYNASNNKAIYR